MKLRYLCRKHWLIILVVIFTLAAQLFFIDSLANHITDKVINGILSHFSVISAAPEYSLS